jgi:hypothetical protein
MGGFLFCFIFAGARKSATLRTCSLGRYGFEVLGTMDQSATQSLARTG